MDNSTVIQENKKNNLLGYSLFEKNGDMTETEVHAGNCSQSVSLAFFPTELLLKIFSYMNFFVQKYTLTSVCEHWKAVCKSPLLNQVINLHGMEFNTMAVTEILTDTPSLKKLNIYFRSDLHFILYLIAHTSKQLKVLRVINCQGSRECKTISPYFLLGAMKWCSQLEELIIKNTLIDDYGRCMLYTIGFMLPNLRKISLVNICLTLREVEAKIIVTHCKKLEEIEIHQLHGTHFTDDFMEAVSLLPQLKVLKINGPFISNEGLKSLNSCNNLSKLHIRYCLRLSDDAVYIMTRFSNLSSFDLTMATNITTDAWLHLFTRDWMKNVLKIVIGQCDAVNDLVLEAIGNSCSSLQHLGLSGCVKISDYGFYYILSGCPNMKCLDLYYTPTKLLKCFLLLPVKMKTLRKLIYRSPCGFQGNRCIIDQLKHSLPDLKVIDTIDSIK